MKKEKQTKMLTSHIKHTQISKFTSIKPFYVLEKCDLGATNFKVTDAKKETSKSKPIKKS